MGTKIRSRSNSSNSESPSKIASKSRKKISPTFWRLLAVWGFLLIGAIALGVRLYILQVRENIPVPKGAKLAATEKQLKEYQGKSLQEIAQAQQTSYLKLYTPRRKIVDAQQNVLATDVITYRLYIHPHLFIRNQQPVKPEDVAKDLAEILGNKTASELLAYFQDKNNQGIPLPGKISESTCRKIRALRIDGLDIRKQYSRIYPHKEMVAEVTGYINEDDDRKPQAGVERTQNKLLARKPLQLKLKRSDIKSSGKTKPVYFPGDLHKTNQSIPFDNLRLELTLDLKLQQAARTALSSTMKKYKALRGTVIVMDTSDGSILAMVCDPTYDPNDYDKVKVEDYSVFKNWAVTDLYEPGSTFKPINVAIALDEKAIKANDTFEDTGKIEIGTDTISNHDFYKNGAKGEVNIPEILQNSSNVGMIKIMERIKPGKYYQRLKDLGIEKKVGIEIPGSTSGRLKDEIEFTVREIEPATASFGQGFSLTPLKLIQLHAAIANGGKLITPHVVKGLSDFDGYSHYTLPKQETKIFSEKTTKTVLEMMETVVEEGSGQKAYDSKYRIAGKTGTSEKSDQSTGSYAENEKITSFVAIFPVEKPRYAVLAVIDEPQGEHTFGSTVAAPVVKEVISAIAAHKGIEPVNKKWRKQRNEEIKIRAAKKANDRQLQLKIQQSADPELSDEELEDQAFPDEQPLPAPIVDQGD